MQTNVIHNIECAEGMEKLIPDESIDLVVTSPPYDNLRSYNGYSFNFEEIAQELWRVIKPGGVIVWVVGDATVKGSETGTSFRQALYFKELGFNLHDTMIYQKKNPMPLTHNRYEQQFEYMFVFSKGRPITFNPIMVDTVSPDTKITTTKREADGVKVTGSGYGKKRNRKRIAYNVWALNVGKGQTTKDAVAFHHPAIFPEKLANDHIISWSNPGDIVLDPFMGSGTTAKMAILNGRKYIGFEMSAEYCEIAEQRVSSVQTPTT